MHTHHTHTHLHTNTVHHLTCTHTHTHTTHTHAHTPQGYLKRCIEYSKLFDTERVETIFSNIEQIYNFQRDFLKELEARVDLDRMEDSQIGEVFVLNVSLWGLKCYVLKLRVET